jgi:6,7-dimethyl-8-ribityllumazine synthase
VGKSTSDIFQTEGILLPEDAFVVMVRTEWNEEYVDRLEKGSAAVLEKENIRYRVLRVPGAVEIGFAVRHAWESGIRPHAFIALGCVIRGGTQHFEYVCKSVTDAITHLNMTLPVPVIFGVLTVENIRQVQERLGGTQGHKGEEAAYSAIKMISLAHSLKNQAD